MKTNYVRKAMGVCMIVCLMCVVMAFNPLNAQTTTPEYYYDYGRDVVLKPIQTICKMDASGKYLVPHLKYFFTYDEEQRVVTKEAYRWNEFTQSWEQSFVLNFTYEEFSTTIDYAVWSKKEKAYALNTEKAVYGLNEDQVISYAFFKWDSVIHEWMLVENLSGLQINPFLLGNGYLLADY